MPESMNLAPLKKLDLPTANAHIRELNARLARLAELIDKLPRALKLSGNMDADFNRLTNVATAVSDDDALPLGQFNDATNEFLRQLKEDLTSEAEETPVSGQGDTSAGGDGSDDAAGQIEGLAPDAAPPKVADASSIGTTTDPLQFSLEDHTHQGVNLDDPQTITGLKTFDRDPAAPFAVTAGSATVANLDADLLDTLDATFFAWLSGRAGGQILNGGTAAGEDLTLSSTSNVTKGNVFIGITSEAFSYDQVNNRLGLAGATANTRLDIDGDFALRANDVTVAAGANDDLDIGEFSTIRLVTGGGAFNVSGFTDGFDGKVLTVHNTTADAWTITNLAGSAAANQIQTLTGADVGLAVGPSIATFYYDATQTNWILISARDSTGAV